MAKLIANRYASSLFDVGLEEEKIEDFHRELKVIDKIFKEEEKLFQIFIHPRISKEEKKSLIDEIFANSISQEVFNFLYIIIDKRREKNLFDIVEEYSKIYDMHRDIIDVVAITAIPMEEDAKNQLKIVLENKLGKNVRLSNELDKSILGGILLKIDDKIIDNTLIRQLKSMENLINNIPV